MTRPSSVPPMPPSSPTASQARFAIFFGPEGFAESVPGLPPGAELARHVPDDAAALLKDLGSAALALVVVHHAQAGILPALRPGPTFPATGVRPPPIVVVGCPDATAVGAAVAGGAEFALRADASLEEVSGLMRAALLLRDLSVLALKDDLTTAWNRRYLEDCLERSLQDARFEGSPVSLIFMDIDDLKSVNVRHGHSAGSRALREVAKRLIRTVRANDAVMRYGGDEFCVLLPGLPASEALDVAERLREVVAAEPFDVDGSATVRLTASFGIAAFPEHAGDAPSLVAAADTAMLSIKDRQKNGIHIAEAP